MASIVLALTLAASINVTGHWEGTVDTPQAAVSFQVDIADVSGHLEGAVTVPSQHVTGLPLTKIAVDGTAVTFAARSDQQMAGVVADDGATIAGTYSVDTYSFPFTLKRTGAPKLQPPLVSAAFGSDLVGTWRGTLQGTSAEMHLVLTVRNDADGTGRATIVNLDEGGLQLPILVTQNGSSVTLESRAVESTFTGALTAAGVLVGTFHQGPASAPLTFRRNE